MIGLSVEPPAVPIRGFASDNAAGVLPEVLAAIAAANHGHATAYGDDPWTRRATARMRAELGAPNAEVAFVYGGTGANVVALAAALQPHEAVLCADTAHVQVDECGAPERLVGCKLLPIPTADGKLTAGLLGPYLALRGDVHHVQPRVVTISQTTELGTLYEPAEVRALADFAHAHGMLLHVDGARLGNAAAALDLPLAAITTEVGVDLLSWGGTKCGLLYGEAVVAWDPALAGRLAFARKQCGQLPSKMRFVATQFEALLIDGLWRRSAQHANRMAGCLAAAVATLPGVHLARPPAANAVFATLPAAAVAPLREQFFFHLWDQERSLARWMTAWDTTEADIEAFAAVLARAVRAA
jgi:threonine aldolase